MTALHTTIITLFPEMFPGPLGHSLIGKALEDGLWTLDCIQLRDFGIGKHKQVDDTPYGGGAGMVLRPDVVDAAIAESFRRQPDAQLIYLTPRGVPFGQRLAAELVASAEAPHPNPLPREREYDSVPALTEKARNLRQNATDVEKMLWYRLRNRQLMGLKFKRQHALERYIVDFFCEDIGLIIELDGGQHLDSPTDAARTAALEKLGFHIIRFWNHDVIDNIEGVLQQITIDSARLKPSPSGEGGVRGKPQAPTSPRPLTFLCGRFESVDERVIDKYQPLEISLGDFVMTGGELAAMAILDACLRLLPGVIGQPESLIEESFGMSEDYACLLEHPHYSKPPVWENKAVPEALLSGHHSRIAQWRLEESERMTKYRRPDLWAAYGKKDKE